ncbi:hypothetical protein GCM10012275_19620 [Longimycelium tulufanense]|uniref:ATP-grasp domain-containing protein n=1 Tax=Longimycelium tulufanense TaxID=907463 RepID=A0A8J3FTS2_9PSEU|nr:hypothetical protein [Longimycelium tulufanense]GGM48756.1 hypothetical protein GCM10012275_19620 [Longimycelium tulufanense]
MLSTSGSRLVRLARELVELGAAGVFAVAGTVEPHVRFGNDVTCYNVGLAGRTHGELGPRFDTFLADPPTDLRAALDRFDPDRQAWVLDTRDLPTGQFAGRRRYGWRRHAWARAEDKTWIHHVWARAGIPAAPSLIVPPEPDALARASRELDHGAGTVWAADTRSGIHGSASGIRWVRDSADAARCAPGFARRCDQVRVMSFVEGWPCTVHGLVMSSGLVALRPLELVVLRDHNHQFVFTGTATYWDCSPDAERLLRATTRQVGEALRDVLDYRGGFTVDGILTGTRFVPTEVNARLGSGLETIEQHRPELHLSLVNRLAQERDDGAIDSGWFQEVALATLATYRGGWVELPLEHPVPPQHRTIELTLDPTDTWRATPPGGTATAVVRTRTSPHGDILGWEPVSDELRGRLIAPLVVSALDFLRRELGLVLPVLTAPRDA